MKVKGKKFISLFLVFSVLTLSIPLTAKERKGADLRIQKTDGTQVRGELIAVKQNSLLLLERDSRADVTINIDDIRVITIVKKWKSGKGFLIWSAVGVGIGAGSVIILGSLQEGFDTEILVLVSLVSGLATGLLGVILSGLSAIDEKIKIEGKSDAEIQEILERLRKKARIRSWR